MPLYQQLIIALPNCPKPDLVALCRQHSKLILDQGGVVRGIENHGIRTLPARAKRFVHGRITSIDIVVPEYIGAISASTLLNFTEVFVS